MLARRARRHGGASPTRTASDPLQRRRPEATGPRADSEPAPAGGHARPHTDRFGAEPQPLVGLAAAAAPLTREASPAAAGRLWGDSEAVDWEALRP